MKSSSPHPASNPASNPAASTTGSATAPESADGRVSSTPTRLRVWDVPVRLFHWLIVLLFGVSWYTGKNGGIDEMSWHLWSGYALLALLAFRVLWGLVGSTSARFSQFIYGPRAAWAYIAALAQRKPSNYLGHTPLGGWMVVAMLLALLVQVGTGLFANDDVFVEGPLFAWVSKATSDWLTTVHKWNFEVLLVLAGLHVAAVLYYALALRENLVAPMFTGRKRLPHGTRAPEYSFVGAGVAAALLLATATGVYLLVT